MANISHDLRTPLAFIYSYAEMMHDFPHEVTSEQSQIIMDEATRLTALVNDMLDISSLETGVAKLNHVLKTIFQRFLQRNLFMMCTAEFV